MSFQTPNSSIRSQLLLNVHVKPGVSPESMCLVQELHLSGHNVLGPTIRALTTWTDFLRSSYLVCSYAKYLQLQRSCWSLTNSSDPFRGGRYLFAISLLHQWACVSFLSDSQDRARAGQAVLVPSLVV
jgi:hypothetical protein